MSKAFENARKMAIHRKPNIEKALEVLLYVAKQVPNMYHALKVIYFADRQHLEQYGRFIYGETYVAMRKGPVPSLAYDIIKSIKGDIYSPVPPGAQAHLSLDEYSIIPRRAPDMDLLSESDVECLDEAITRYGHMPHRRLCRISHRDKAFRSTNENDLMSLAGIAASLPNGDKLLAHLENG